MAVPQKKLHTTLVDAVHGVRGSVVPCGNAVALVQLPYRRNHGGSVVYGGFQQFILFLALFFTAIRMHARKL